MKQYVEKALIVMFFGLFFGGGIQAQEGFTPDLSMTLAGFEKQVLQPKNEIWIVDFWASWCRPCIELIPELKLLAEQFPDKRIRFISISYDQEKEDWLAAVNHFKIPWQQILIPNSATPQQFIEANFRHKYIPTLFIVYPNGKVNKTDEWELKKLLEKQLKKMDKISG